MNAVIRLTCIAEALSFPSIICFVMAYLPIFLLQICCKSPERKVKKLDLSMVFWFSRRLPFKQGVRGSNPRWSTSKNTRLSAGIFAGAKDPIRGGLRPLELPLSVSATTATGILTDCRMTTAGPFGPAVIIISPGFKPRTPKRAAFFERSEAQRIAAKHTAQR